MAWLLNVAHYNIYYLHFFNIYHFAMKKLLYVGIDIGILKYEIYMLNSYYLEHLSDIFINYLSRELVRLSYLIPLPIL